MRTSNAKFLCDKISMVIKTVMKILRLKFIQVSKMHKNFYFYLKINQKKRIQKIIIPFKLIKEKENNKICLISLIIQNSMLSQIIQSNNSQQIEQFIKKKLPNNPQSLERIYFSLTSFTQALNQFIKLKSSTKNNFELSKNKQQFNHNSSNKLNYKKSINNYYDRHSTQSIAKRQQSLIRNLRQKGMRPDSQLIPLGMEIIKNQERKISQPLQSNSLAQLKIKQSTSEISKCIKRFNLNKKFYSNSINDAHIDQQKYFDKDMKRFIDMRTQSLNRLKNQQEFANEFKQANTRRFSNVESILSKKTGMSLGIETTKNSSNTQINFSINKKNKIKDTVQFTNKKTFQTDEIIKYCTNSLQKQDKKAPKQLLAESKKFKTLREKAESISNQIIKMSEQLEFDGMELENKSEQIDKMAKNCIANGLIDKYTLSYIKLIMSRPKNEIISANRKDLIKNQPRFRFLLSQSNS